MPHGGSKINRFISVSSFRVNILMLRGAKDSSSSPFVNRPARMSVSDDTGVINERVSADRQPRNSLRWR